MIRLLKMGTNYNMTPKEVAQATEQICAYVRRKLKIGMDGQDIPQKKYLKAKKLVYQQCLKNNYPDFLYEFSLQILLEKR